MEFNIKAGNTLVDCRSIIKKNDARMLIRRRRVETSSMPKILDMVSNYKSR